MECYKVIKVSSEDRSAFTEFIHSINGFSQILDSESEKPLVIHYKTNQSTYIEKGKGFAAIYGNIIEIEEGDLILISEGTSHSFLTLDEPITLYHWHWPQEYIETDRYILESYYVGWDKVLSAKER
jgi:mannose-6-phosphate isomerase-like protein (cupin superfamily)